MTAEIDSGRRQALSNRCCCSPPRTVSALRLTTSRRRTWDSDPNEHSKFDLCRSAPASYHVIEALGFQVMNHGGACMASIQPVTIGNLQVGPGQPLLWIAGPCVIETHDLTLRIAETLRKLSDRLHLPLIF